VIYAVHVVEGESADCCGALGVEEDQAPGEAVLGLEGGVVEQPACLFPSGLGVDDARRAGPPVCGQVEAGRFPALGPADEVPGVGMGVGGRRGGPLVQVAVPRRREGEVVKRAARRVADRPSPPAVTLVGATKPKRIKQTPKA
jgi:hypothetical protein